LKPVVCSEDKCVFRYAELGLGASVFFEMKQDPDYVDLMVSMTYAAAESGRRDKILSPFPEEFITDRVLMTKDFEGLKAVLNHMPSIDEMLLAASDERELRTMLEAKEPRLYRVLRWILSSNRAHLQKLPQDKQVSDMATPHQYLLFSNSPEKEARFRVHKQQHPTVWAFHGSAIENWCVTWVHSSRVVCVV
jgi:poly [ADP-ribose] polymerase 6/8